MSIGASKGGHPSIMSQAERFTQAAHEIEVDEYEAHWEARVKTIARQKPKDAPEKPE